MATYDTIGIAATGDFLLDLGGNFVVISGIEQVAQDSWLAAQCFLNDLYFDQDTGIPYFVDILGGNPPDSLIAHDYIKTIAEVNGVDDVAVSDIAMINRNLTAKITVTDFEGAEVVF